MFFCLDHPAENVYCYEVCRCISSCPFLGDVVDVVVHLHSILALPYGVIVDLGLGLVLQLIAGFVCIKIAGKWISFPLIVVDYLCWIFLLIDVGDFLGVSTGSQWEMRVAFRQAVIGLPQLWWAAMLLSHCERS